ncbi:MAG: hypothetical protein MUP13_03265, partial [Thermoanaerobaculales bacterium]|nr:hypothetical protein [Thermoanaerobaculales bacterium]
ADWMVPAVAHNRGSQGTFWKTDVSLHNPHEFDLPIVVQALPSDTVNLEVPTLTFTIYPWETIILWDVLGPDVFDVEGTAAFIAYADPALRCDPIEDCHFLVTSRTYTPEQSGDGEYGLTVPGAAISSATDWSTYGYAAGVLNDGDFFRCNAGVASWTPDWTRVRLDRHGGHSRDQYRQPDGAHSSHFLAHFGLRPTTPQGSCHARTLTHSDSV